MRTTRSIAGAAAGALLAATVAAAATAPAASAGGPQPSDVTVVHGIPGATVDVYAGGSLLIEDFEFGDFANPVPVNPGNLEVQVFAANANPDTATPVIDQTVSVPSGKDVSLVANLDVGGTPELTPFVEMNKAVSLGEGRVSVRHTADAPEVDITANGGDVITALPNGSEDSVDVPARAYGVTVQVAPSGPTALNLGSVPVKAGEQLNVYAVGSAGGGSLTVLTQVVDVVELTDVRVVHGIPGATVDVYVNDGLTLEDFTPETVSGTLELMPGPYRIEVFAANDDPNSDAAVIDQIVDVPEGLAVSVVANLAGTGPNLAAFVDDQSPTLPGQGRVVVRHTADAPTVDIQVNGSDALTGLEQLAEDSASLPGGTYDFGVQVAPDGPVALPLDDVAIDPGTVTTVYAIGSAGGATLTAVVVVDGPGEGFTDVDGFDLFFDEIQYLLDQGISKGFGDGTFRPLTTIARQELAAFLYRLSEGHGAAPTCTEAPFTDVPVGHPFCGEIQWLKDQGISVGNADGSFGPTAPVNRGSFSAFLYRYDGAETASCTEAPFTDVSVSHPFCKEIAWMDANGYARGFGDGTFRPANQLNRQEQAGFLYRYLEALAVE